MQSNIIFSFRKKICKEKKETGKQNKEISTYDNNLMNIGVTLKTSKKEKKWL